MIPDGVFIFSVSISLFQIIVLAVVLVLSVNLIIRSSRDQTVVFLAFSYALWLLADLYWIAYDLIRPESRMPFAANEIGEAAIFLVMAAFVNSALKYKTDLPLIYTVGTIAFVFCNVILWISWSGEWLQDIFIGVAFAWFMYGIVRALYNRNVLSCREWIILGISCAAVIICQALTFAVDAKAGHIAELAAYGILIFGVCVMCIKLYFAYRKKEDPRSLLFMVCLILVWAISGKYMSEGFMYNFFLLTETLCLPAVYLTLRKAVINI